MCQVFLTHLLLRGCTSTFLCVFIKLCVDYNCGMSQEELALGDE